MRGTPALAGPPLAGDWREPDLHGFAAHNGPVWVDGETSRLALQIQPARTNITGRLYGGMAMSLQSLALAQAVRRAARQAQPQGRAELLTFNCELIDSAVACANGDDRVDTGMLAMLADLYTSGAARIASGRICVTLSRTLSQLVPIRLGDLVEIESRAEGHGSEVVIVTGSFRVDGRQVMTATSAWKMIATA